MDRHIFSELHTVKQKPGVIAAIGCQEKTECGAVDGVVGSHVEPLGPVFVLVKEEPRDEPLEDWTMCPASSSAVSMCEVVFKEEVQVEQPVTRMAEGITGTAGRNKSHDRSEGSCVGEQNRSSPSDTQYSSLNVHVLDTSGVDSNMYNSPVSENIAEIQSCTITDVSSLRNVGLAKPRRCSRARSVACKNVFSCTNCLAKFGDKFSLKKHMLSHAGDACKICSLKFARKQDLLEHMSEHTGEKPFSCIICSARFGQKLNMYQHMYIHTEENLFSCKFCTAKFTQEESLKSHLVTHTVQKPFSCTLCPAKFTQKGRLESHIHTHTGEKPLSCTVCSAKFSHRWTLKAHIFKHAEYKTFSCTICSAKFIQKKRLKSHLRTHTEGKPFSCTLCPATFSYRRGLTKHVLDKHS